MTITPKFNTPQPAKPRGREVLQVQPNQKGSGWLDMWLHPEQYRSNGSTDNHSLDLLA